MCGFVGIASPQNHSHRELITAMSDVIARRGPDDSGEFYHPHGLISFGFRRLAIVDLTAAGHQPMHSRSARFTIVFNGEIYNAKVLATELRALGHEFVGHSDTEVLLAAFEEWGIDSAINRSTGMFAIACWDEAQQTLSLIRDRFGEKPLYYGWGGGGLRFGSNLRAITYDLDPTICPTALDRYLGFGYVPAPLSIYQGFYKLLPGSIFKLAPESFSCPPEDFSPRTSPSKYWSPSSVLPLDTVPLNTVQLDSVPLVTVQPRYSDAEVAQRFETQLASAVQGQMVSDVPLGAFLSGGIDSSTIVALMQSQSSKPVKTFTIGFDEQRFNEAPFARAIAEHLGTEHTELSVSNSDLIDVVRRLGDIFDEPFADSSQIPTLLVAELARRSVTVSLSGDGGDELFGGYTRYPACAKLSRILRLLPHSLRCAVAGIVGLIPDSVLDSLLRPLVSAARRASPSDHAKRATQLLCSRTFAELYARAVTMQDSSLLRPEVRQNSIRFDPLSWWQQNSVPGLSDQRTMMLVDSNSYLPDDILVKLDRTTMSASLEGRVPLLDHSLWELLWSLPSAQGARLLHRKRLLKDILRSHVPESLTNRPKMGFGVPLAYWLRGALRAWAEDLLSVRELESAAVFNTPAVREIWREFVGGRDSASRTIWALLMFQSWRVRLRRTG